MVALKALYPRLSSEGCVIIDDYGAVPACKQAVVDFRRCERISEEINVIDWGGVW